jgi:hypothetical protein
MAVNWDDSRTEDAEDGSTKSGHDLSWAYDDPEEPTALTVYAETEPEIHTQWISVDVRFAIELEKCR